MRILFWLALAVIFYAYCGYPLILLVQKKLAAKPVGKRTPENPPLVSIIVVGRNEGKNIESRLQNLCQQDYPPNKLEILFLSDGSSDRTVAIAQVARARYADTISRCLIIESSPAQGKLAGLNRLVSEARGEIVVFTDCRQRFKPQVVAELVANFSDKAVGAVSGELFFANATDGAQAEMGLYWRYEKAIRKLESISGSVIGVTGAVYALRRELFRPHLPATILDDVVTPLLAMRQGYRVIFDERAIAWDKMSENIDQEWGRKLRTLTGNWQILSQYPFVFIHFRAQLFFRFFSHKISRLFVPFALIGLFVASLFLDGCFFRLALAGQILGYALTIAALVRPAWQKFRLMRLAAFFCLLNAAAFASFFVWMNGGSGTVWKTPSTRHEQQP